MSLAEVIDAALATVMPAADAKGVRILKMFDSLAGPVTGDPARLQQVVWNLLSNAVKFTPKGGRIQILLERVNSHVEITVTDTGIGIKPEFLPFVFDRFRQADASTTRRHGGLGLGLSIVKQLVEMHGGTVRAKSPGENRGARSPSPCRSLVVHDQEESRQVRPKEPIAAETGFAPALLEGMSVLVVDDEPDARELIKRLLAESQADVLVAGSVAEALEPARPTAVPRHGQRHRHARRRTAIDLIREVRGRGLDAKDLPAIALTAFARSEDRRRAMLAGFQVHVAKPVDPTSSRPSSPAWSAAPASRDDRCSIAPWVERRRGRPTRSRRDALTRRSMIGRIAHRATARTVVRRSARRVGRRSWRGRTAPGNEEEHPREEFELASQAAEAQDRGDQGEHGEEDCKA